MGFPENLKKRRIECHLSQEELAELLEVSRQAVSKWEQGMGYPEVEKLLLISRKLNISLDLLMFDDDVDSGFRPSTDVRVSGQILIRSPHENVIVTCSKVMSSEKMRGGKNSPQYALYGSSGDQTSFWGHTNTFLAWYANHELISKEIEEIYSAILRGDPAYTLQYSAKTQRNGMSVKILS